MPSGAVTLIELLVALAILGLLIALVPVALNNITPRWRLRSAAHQIESLALWAQNAAATRKVAVQIMYDLEEGAAWVRQGDETLSRKALPSGVRFTEVRFATDVLATSDIAAAAVFPDGTLDAHSVTIQNNEGDRAVLSFNRLTGHLTYTEDFHGT